MKLRKSLTQRYRNAQQGSVLVCVLVCLAITTSLIGSNVRSALNARRTIRTQLQLRQTELLLAAGIQRARRQLHSTAADLPEDYMGETWSLPPSIFPHVESALVQIDVAPVGDTLTREVRVTARLSVAASRTLQRSTRFTFDLEQESTYEDREEKAEKATDDDNR